MFTLEDRKKAVLQLIKFDMQYATTIRKLGYPNDWRTLKKWYTEYIDTGELHPTRTRTPKYTYEQKKYAVEYYVSHGKNVEKTIRNIGYVVADCNYCHSTHILCIPGSPANQPYATTLLSNMGHVSHGYFEFQ